MHLPFEHDLDSASSGSRGRSSDAITDGTPIAIKLLKSLLLAVLLFTIAPSHGFSDLMEKSEKQDELRASPDFDWSEVPLTLSRKEFQKYNGKSIRTHAGETVHLIKSGAGQ